MNNDVTNFIILFSLFFLQIIDHNNNNEGLNYFSLVLFFKLVRLLVIFVNIPQFLLFNTVGITIIFIVKCR